MKHDGISVVVRPISAVLLAWMIVPPGIASGAECVGKSVAECADLLAQKVDDLANENARLKARIDKAEETISHLQKSSPRIETSAGGNVLTLTPGNTARATFKKPFDDVPAIHTSIEIYTGGNVSTPTGSYLRFGTQCQADKLGITCSDQADSTPNHSATISWIAIGN